MVSIKPPEKQEGKPPIFKIAGAATGILTGNPVAVIGSLSPDSPLGNAIGLADTAGGIGKNLPKSAHSETPVDRGGIGSELNGQAPSLMGNDSSPNAPSLEGRGQAGAMSRALDQASQNPAYKIHQGLQALNDPEFANSMPYDHYMGAVKPLLRAKFFGVGGGQDQSGNGQMDNGGY